MLRQETMTNDSTPIVPIRPRFIAGAICPQCKAMDRLVVDMTTDARSCVECGFSEKRPQDVTVEPVTRVTRGSARLVETVAEPVRMMMPDADND
jgi:uncharacterized metal-binding protein (TIGR02443 family)